MSKYLINDSFKALRTGEFVEASANSGEFIYDTASADEHALATIMEVAKANGLSISSKTKKGEAIELLNAHLETLPLPEVNKMTDTQKVEEIIAAGIAAEKTDDEMLVDIVNAGIPFKAAGKLFSSVMESKGLRVSAKDRAEKAEAILVAMDFGAEAPKAEDVQAAVKKIMDGISDTTEKQAMGAIRKFAKAKKLELPKKSAGSKGEGGSGLIKKLTAWMLANRECDEKAIAAHIQEIKPDISEGQLKKYTAGGLRYLAFAKAWSGDVVDEAPTDAKDDGGEEE